MAFYAGGGFLVVDGERLVDRSAACATTHRGSGLRASPSHNASSGNVRSMTARDDEDAALLKATPGDREAFATFYRRHEEAVLVFMLRRTGQPEVAADLTAEVFAAALAGAARFRFVGAPPAAWLFGIARNVLAASFRAARVQNKMRRRLEMPVLALSDELVDRLDQLADIARGREALDLLEHLPDAQRQAIRAHIMDEKDYTEIASSLQCSSSVVRQRVSRGLATLRTQLDQGASNA